MASAPSSPVDALSRLLTGLIRLVFSAVALSVFFTLFITLPAEAHPGGPTDTPLLTLEGQVGGIAFGVATQGGWGFVGVGPRVIVLDLNQPNAPEVARSPVLPGVVQAIIPDGQRLYVALGDQGVQILDISDPKAPSPVGRFTTFGQVTDVALVGNYAYVASVFDSFRIFDVSDPTQVSQVGVYDGVTIAEGVAVAGDYAYLAAGDDGLVTVDVSTPAKPKAGGRLDTNGYARDVQLQGATAFVADGYGSPTVVAVDVSNPVAPARKGGYATPGEAYALDLAGATLYVVTWNAGLYLLDVSNPGAPTLLGSVDTPGRAVDVAVTGSQALVADDWGGWRRVSVADPAHPSIVAETSSPGEVEQVAVAGKLAVFLDNSLGAFAVDISDPAHLTLAGRNTDISGAVGTGKDVVLVDGRGYVIQGDNIRVLNVLNPSTPVAGASLATPGQAQALAASGGLLAVADGAAGVQIYSLANPDQPTLVGSYATGADEATDVLLDGDMIYAAAGGLHVVDVSNPATPKRIGFYKPQGNFWNMAKAGHFLYLCGGFAGVWTINVSNPATPVELAHTEEPLIYGCPIAAVNNTIFVADNAGLKWWDMTDPAHPQDLGSYPTQVGDLMIQNGTLFVAGVWSGLLSFALPKAATVSEVRPNQGQSVWANTVNVYGSNFQAGATAQLTNGARASVPLTVASNTPNQLGVIVPAGVASGVYDLRITNPDGGQATLPNAYTVIPSNQDVLYAYADELWVGPDAARRNQATGVGLVVHRAGGNGDRTDVTVDFYVGDPKAGGVHLGQEAIAHLAPNNYATTTGVPWAPTSDGQVTLYAVIQPGAIPVSRTLEVLPAAVDVTPPTVDSVQGPGSQDVSTPNLRLTVRASDDPGGSGVGAIYVRELDWNPNLGAWLRVKDSSWLDFTGSPMTVDWTLSWAPGIKALVVWAGDRAGNVSVTGFVVWLNFMPPAMSLNQGLWHIFGYDLNAGDTLSAVSTPTAGDPDLYVTRTGAQGWLDYSLNEGTVADSVSTVASIQDLYLVCVYGWTTTRYGLSVNVGATRLGRFPNRTPVTRPGLPTTDIPPQALPTAPTGHRVYLPFID